MTGNADYIGADVGWTIDELNEALAAAEIGAKAVPNSCTRSEILSNVINFNSNEYIDLKNGECNFDTPEFAKLLEFIKSFPESPNYSSGSDEQSAIMGGRLLVHQTIYNGFGSVLTEEIRLGGKVAYKGFPCESRNGSVAETVETLAISSVSEHKDAAWSFIRQFLTPDYQRGMFDGFPSNKILFNEQAAYWTTDTYDENGKLIPKGYIYKGYTSEIESTYGAMSLEQLNKFRVFLRSVDSMTSYDWTLGEIISQEAAAFFAGDKTAEETAALIQNRVGLYVGERQ
ncbi:MAG: extracellular solute-binding protein, partial [Oscillospiraceae bacterium]|jgi:ABC-type glycerol-3-phosphate transport system substrate-binding protein|nr:extracellular solute-binding protein [Oscillospiraceae bacterium]